MPDYTGIYRGAVHNVNDPENRGRIQALVPAALGDAVSAWAEPMLPTAEFTNWQVGDRVFVLFEDGDINHPTYFSRMEVRQGDIAPGAVTKDALSVYAIDADYLTANHAFIDALNATDFTAVTITAPTIQSDPDPARGIKWDTGLRAYGPTGDIFFNVNPIDGIAMVAGLITSKNLTVSDPITVGAALAAGQPVPTLSTLGGITEVANGGAVRLTGATTAPVSAPRLDSNYDTLQLSDPGAGGFAQRWQNTFGAAYGGGYIWTVSLLPTASGSVFNYINIARWDPITGVRVSSISDTGKPGVDQVCGIAYASGGTPALYVLFRTTDARGNSRYWVISLDTGLTTELGSWEWTGNDGTRTPCISYDPASNELMIAQSRASTNNLWVKRYPRPTASTTTFLATSTLNTNANFTGSVVGILYGTFDFGAPRYVFTNDVASGFRTMDSTGNEPGTEGWPSDMTNKVGFFYDGARFVSLDPQGQAKYYTGLWSRIPENQIKWVSNTLVGAGPRTTRVTLSTGLSTITGQFTPADSGSPISGTGIPVGATVTYVNDTTATLSSPATSGGVITATITSLLETPASPASSIALPNRAKLLALASTITTDSSGVPDSIYFYVGSGASYSVTAKAIASNIITLTIGTHNLVVGNTVTVSGMGSPFDGTATVTATTATTFSYSKGTTLGSLGTTSATGTVKLTTFPGRTRMARQPAPAMGVNSAAFSTLVPTPGTNPPATSTFPASTGSSHQDRLGNVIIDQDGVFRKGSIANDTFLASLFGWVGGAQGSYSVSWTGSTSNPTLGNGTLVGTFRQVGKVVDFKIILTLGSSTNFGVGGWFFSLPVAAADSRGVVGRAVFRTAGVDYTRTAILNGNSSLIQLQREDGNRFSATDAATTYSMVSGDTFYISGRYEAA